MYSQLAHALAIAVIATLLVAPPAGAAEYFVDPVRGDDSNDGLSPETAKLTMENAIGLVESGDVITLLPGTYTESFTLSGKNNITLRGLGEVIIAAGANNISSCTNVTIRGLTFRNTGSSVMLYVSDFNNGLIEDCRFIGLDGVGCTGVTGDSGYAQWTIRRCTFAGCGLGLELWCRTRVQRVEHCTFYGNGTGLSSRAFTEIRPLITNNSFVGNTLAVKHDNTGGDHINIFYNHFFNNTEDTQGVPGAENHNPVYGDPLFVDPDSYAFYVREGSPLLTGGHFGRQIGAYGQSFHTSSVVDNDEPEQGESPWEHWVVLASGGYASFDDPASPVELNEDGEVVLKEGIDEAWIYSPVFDTGCDRTLLRSVDYTAYEDSSLADEGRLLIDWDPNTPRQEIRVRHSRDTAFVQTPFETAPPDNVYIEALDKQVKCKIRARYVQTELVLRRIGG